MRIKSNEDDKQAPRTKEPIEMTSDELLDYALAPELAEKVKQAAKPPEESTDSEQEC
jgi:predicted DNA-binding protein